jgi:hypothetical protein
MIVEFPNPNCIALGFERDAIWAARPEALDTRGSFSTFSFAALRGTVRIKGVGFWDEIHGQTDVTPNQDRATSDAAVPGPLFAGLIGCDDVRRHAQLRFVRGGRVRLGMRLRMRLSGCRR